MWTAGLSSAYTAYSNASLVASYSAAQPADPILENGIPVTGISGTTGNTKFWKITPGAGKQLRITISGGTGDADLYVRFGSRPTTTTWQCRPYLNGNNETCTIPNTQAGDYYIMLRAYATYSGVTLRGSF